MSFKPLLSVQLAFITLLTFALIKTCYITYSKLVTLRQNKNFNPVLHLSCGPKEIKFTISW